MSDKEKLAVATAALEEIREATYAEFQFFPEPDERFDPKKHACPYCGRGSTATHLRGCWALVQAAAAKALRTIEDDGRDS